MTQINETYQLEKTSARRVRTSNKAVAEREREERTWRPSVEDVVNGARTPSL